MLIERNHRDVATTDVAGWRWKGLVLVALCLLATFLPLPALAAEYAIAPAPAWVERIAPGTPSKQQLAHAENGMAYLLIDGQVRIAAPDRKDRYRRFVKQALNAKGVETIANIEIPFDPSYQSLTLHAIDIVRGGRVIPKLAGASIRILQRETELDSLIYDGSKSANIFLDDVRPGDVVDYAYTLSGRNSVFAGRDFGDSFLEYEEPSARVHVRLLAPAGEPLTVAGHHGVRPATIREHDGLRDYNWDASDTAASTVDKDTPDWYFPYAQVEWSQFPDWATVARWAVPLYKVPGRVGPVLQREVDRIARTQSGEAGRALAALRLVQGEVRYLGIEIGANSHAPNPPDVVFARRFGDCKDKTLLTLTLLHQLGIEAHAALVNTDRQRGIADALPNPALFDHVIVQARVDGAWYWLDPTRPAQLSDLAHIYQPDYGLALPVDPGTRRLVAMKAPHVAVSSRHIQVLLDAHAGFEKPVHYTIVTTYEGGEAESQRDQFASMTLGDAQKNYLNYYANAYQGITVDKPLEVVDDKPGNRLITTEHYLVAHIAARDAKNHSTVDVATPDIDELLRDPEVTVRKSPLHRKFPLDVSQSTKMLLPETWPDKSESQSIANPAFRFDRHIESHGATVAIDDHFRALADEVPVPDMPRLLADLARGRDNLGYQVSWNGDPGATPSTPAVLPAPVAAIPLAAARAIDKVNWSVSLLGLACLAICGWFAMRVYRHDPPPREVPVDAPRGLGGWMILMVIGLLMTIYKQGVLILTTLGTMSPQTWTKLTTYGSSLYRPGWAPLLLSEYIANIVLFVWVVLLVVLMFQRRRNFPRLAAALYVAACVYMACDLWIATGFLGSSLDHADRVSLGQSIVRMVIWVPYLLVSRRVKATSINTWRGRDRVPVGRAVVAG